MHRHIFPCVLALAFCLLLPATSSAQNLAALRDQAQKAFEAGNFKEAVTAAQEFLQKDPENIDADKVRLLLGLAQYSAGDYKACADTFADPKKLPEDFLPTVQFHLGASRYFLGQHEQAIAPLTAATQAKDEESKANIVPYAQYYIGRAHMDRGSKLDEAKDKAGAAKAWDSAVAAFSTFLTNHPNHELFTDVATARATAYVLMGKLDEALKDLEAMKAKPESAAIADDIDFLTGFVLTQSAQKLQADFKEEEAKAVIERARETYERLAKSPNLVMANQAAFQLANLLFAARDYEAAIAAFRAIRSKGDLIASQEARIEAARRAVSDASGNRDRVRALQQALKREEQKLVGVKNSPETAVDGLSRIGDSFLQLGSKNPVNYDLARLVYRFASQFANDDQKKLLDIQTVITFALQGLADRAETKYAEFRQKYPNDPMAENVPFLLGQALQRQGKHQEAIAKFQESLQKFPNARITGQIPKEIAASQVALGKPEEALKTFDTFINDAKAGKIKIAPEALEDAMRQRALALLAAKKTDEAVKAMQELATTAKTPAIQEEAAFQTAAILSQAGKNEEAAKAFGDFAQKFPTSPRATQAEFFTAVSLERAKKTAEALAAYRAMAEKHKGTDIGIQAMDKIWRLLLAANQLEEMVKAQDALLEAYPQAPQSMLALYERAKFLDEKKKQKIEAAAAYRQVYDFYKKLPAELLQSTQGEKMSEFPSASLARSAEIKRREAAALGDYTTLDDAKKAEWKSMIQSSRGLLEQSVTEFPKSNALGFALQRLVDVMLMEIRAGLSTLNDSATALSKLAGNLQDENAQVQTLIARASLTFQAGQAEQALLFYDEAFKKISNPKSMSWQDYDRYGSILLENQKWDRALEVYGQLKDNFTDQRAQAAAVYGVGAASQGKGDLARAETLFKELKEKYPWSEKIQEAEFGRAMALINQAKYEEGFDVLKQVLGTTRSSNETKARSMIAFARTFIEMGDKNLKTDETKQGENQPDMNIYELAHNNANKVVLFYKGSLPQLAAEALYLAADARFKQSRTETDPAKKKAFEDGARKLVDELLRDFPTSPWAEKGRALK